MVRARAPTPHGGVASSDQPTADAIMAPTVSSPSSTMTASIASSIGVCGCRRFIPRPRRVALSVAHWGAPQ